MAGDQQELGFGERAAGVVHTSTMRRWDEGLWIFTIVMMAGAASMTGQTGGPQNAAAAQVESTAAKVPVYDVVSIKQNKSEAARWTLTPVTTSTQPRTFR